MHKLKIILLILISPLFSFIPSIPENNVALYEQALKHIKNSSEYLALSKGKNKYYVSNELPSVYLMGSFYREELHEYINLSQEDFIAKSNDSVYNNTHLPSLSTKKRVALKIYFSEIKNNIFFSEIFNSPKRETEYQKRPHFGTSYIYMFQVKNNMVILIKVKKIAYN